MKTILSIFTLLVLGFPAWAQAPVHGRVSFDNGSVMLRGGKGEEWAHATMNSLVMTGDSLWIEEEGVGEIEFAGGTVVRLADAAKAEVVALEPGVQLQVWVGSLYVQRCPGATGTVTLETPAALVEMAGEGLVRVDVGETGYTTVETVAGEASIRLERSVDVVPAGSRIMVEPGMLPSSIEPVDAEGDDLFDAWNRERSAFCEAVTAVEGIDRTVIGAAPLKQYGEWVTVENERYWRPKVTNYVPYREGYWSPVRDVGSVWVGTQPFSYITSHYGRWRHVEQYGWLWRYEKQWSPAWAATVRYGEDAVWAPVDWDLRPVVPVRSTYVEIGGLRFGIEAMSYVPLQHLYGGYEYVSPFRQELYRPDVNVSLWNISMHDRYRFNVPFQQAVLANVWAPESVNWRGLRAYEGVPALGRVELLETKHGRKAFKDLTKAVVKMERTVLKAGGGPKGRAVKLNKVHVQEPKFRGNAGGGGGGPKVKAGGNGKGQGQGQVKAGGIEKNSGPAVKKAPAPKPKSQRGGGNVKKSTGPATKEQKSGGAAVKQGGGGNAKKDGGAAAKQGGGNAKKGGGGGGNKGGSEDKGGGGNKK